MWIQIAMIIGKALGQSRLSSKVLLRLHYQLARHGIRCALAQLLHRRVRQQCRQPAVRRDAFRAERKCLELAPALRFRAAAAADTHARVRRNVAARSTAAARPQLARAFA